MPITARSLPVFKKICHVTSVEKNLCVTFETASKEYFQIVLEPMVSSALVHTLLEKTPSDPSLENTESFPTPVKSFHTGILEGGQPVLGVNFRSGIPVTLALNEEAIDSMIYALSELKDLVSENNQNAAKH